jgi:hypothetical protein
MMVAAGDRLANVIATTTAAILAVPWMLISLCLDRPMPLLPKVSIVSGARYRGR